MILWDYWRSTAAYRVRIALNLKGLAAEHRVRHLRRGEQRAPDYLALNPQGLVPALVLEDGTVLTQSLAICEYLDETHPEPPLLPRDPVTRAKVRAFAQAIAAEIHAVQNLKVLNRVKALGHDQAAANAWAQDTIAEGLAACEALLRDQAGPFCFGAAPGRRRCRLPGAARLRRGRAGTAGGRRIGLQPRGLRTSAQWSHGMPLP